MGGMGIYLAYAQGQVCLLVGSIMLHVLHAGMFLLDADMKLVLLFCSLVTIQST
jgi:hypothetical protein